MPIPSRTDDILVFLPALNDGDGIGSLAQDIQRQSPRFRVLIIDDGSAHPLDVPSLPENCLSVSLPDNFGLGVCTHVAFDHAALNGYDIVVRVDADGQHPVDRITDLIAPIDAGEADMTVGGRSNQNDGGGVRAILGALVKGYLSLVSRIITRGKAPRDVSTGFIAFGRRAVDAVNEFNLERYPEAQIFILAVRADLRVSEIPVEQRQRRSGRSSIRMSQALQILYRFNVFVLGEVLRWRGK